jgi:hypothetical protein
MVVADIRKKGKEKTKMKKTIIVNGREYILYIVGNTAELLGRINPANLPALRVAVESIGLNLIDMD